MIPHVALPRADDPAIGGERAFLKWGAIVSAECAGGAVVVAQTRHKDFICRLFAVLGLVAVCELERFPEDSSKDGEDLWRHPPTSLHL